MPSLDVERARELGATVGSGSHDDLTEDQLEALEALFDEVDAALENDVSTAATTLLAFWGGHVAADAELTVDGTTAAALEPVFDEGFHADVLGVDLYQALEKTATAVQTDAGPDLDGWASRLAELTNRHVAHLLAHGNHGDEPA